jgi:FlaG/FlaF family flagellin (archaellin)
VKVSCVKGLEGAADIRSRTFRRRNDGVSAVLGEIMLVAITIVLAVVLYLMVSAPSSPPSQPISLLLEQKAPTHNATNASRNDTAFQVTAKLGTGDILWNDSSLQTTIVALNGTQLLGHAIQYNDGVMDGKAGAGDSIIIHGMTNAYHGATFQVFYKGRLVYTGMIT